MIPALIGGAIAASSTISWAITSGGTAGMSYALGRKYGRKICNWLDNVEDRVVEIIKVKNS